jgi:hypothetical protein|tara:strand:- start:862 stop:1023 length:162 start_codon:yes stop_codon:yes gene_type:complete
MVVLALKVGGGGGVSSVLSSSSIHAVSSAVQAMIASPLYFIMISVATDKFTNF